MPIDLYQGMSDFYDIIVQQNRDYKAVALEMSKLFGNRKDILDIGIGTGLLVEQLLQLQPQFRISGVDTSTSLLAQARSCLGTRVNLYCQDIANLHLDKNFELAYSRGGAWTFVHDGNTVLLASHILDIDLIQRSFERVAVHLQKEGLLIISSSNGNHDKHYQVDGDILLSRNSSKEWVDGEQYLIVDYACNKNGILAGNQRIRVRLLEIEQAEDMLRLAGLHLISHHNNQYFIYQKSGLK